MNIPQSEPAKRIASLYRRRLITPWSDKEIRVLWKLVRAHCFDSLDDLELIERYYAFERKKGEKGIHRRDLYTFLNNYLGELDRARAWAEKHPKESRSAPSVKAQPARWEEFLDAEYPGASNRDFWSAPGDVQRECRAWEKK